MELPAYVPIVGNIDIKQCIAKRYDLGKKVVTDIWHKPKDQMTLEDIFHDTLYKCIKALGDRKMPEEEIHAYFFKAFRINMVRYYGYSYNKTTSGAEVEKLLIPISNENEICNHIDGFQMVDLIGQNFGNDVKDMLWYQLQGHTYEYMDKIFKTNTYYQLSKAKKFLKEFYNKTPGKLILPHKIYK